MTTEQPTIDEHGHQFHPAFAVIGASHVQGTAVLFDSEIIHRNYVVLTISRATRRRELNRDWILEDRQLIEIAMSEAQWASFVSSMNSTPSSCTITYEGYERVPDLPYEPRLALSMQETKDAAARVFEHAREAFAVYKEHKTAGNLRNLEAALVTAVPNVDYATKTLSEHIENTVVKAKADIEAMAAQHVERLGIDSSGYTAPLELSIGILEGES